jgi:hypothetical protein
MIIGGQPTLGLASGLSGYLDKALVPVLLVFTIATLPGEWLDQILPSAAIVPVECWR